MSVHNGLLSKATILFYLLLSVQSVTALNYFANVDKSEWNTSVSPFECRLWQPIPHYGDAVFSQQAGSEQQFYLSPHRAALKSGEVDLVSRAPVWLPDRASRPLGSVQVKDAQYAIQLDKTMSSLLLSELYDGMAPEFSGLSWYNEDVDISVALSSASFRRAYREYSHCLSGLLPVSFDQIARSRLYFSTSKTGLLPATKQRLDLIVRYVKADAKVKEFVIDGHTDTIGKKLNNIDLSKARAENVIRYLTDRGIDKSKIVMRYFGESFPIASNDTAAGRAKNRRVTIRLERAGI